MKQPNIEFPQSDNRTATVTEIPLIVNDDLQLRDNQDIAKFALDSKDMIGLLSMYDPYGVWKIDLESGKVHWSRDVYEIHCQNYTEGVVDLNAAIAAYHPEDAKIVAQLIDETIINKSSFRFVLRLKIPDGPYKMVKAVAKYRVTEDGKEEIFGLFSEFQLPVRNIATR